MTTRLQEFVQMLYLFGEEQRRNPQSALNRVLAQEATPEQVAEFVYDAYARKVGMPQSHLAPHVAEALKARLVRAGWFGTRRPLWTRFFGGG